MARARKQFERLDFLDLKILEALQNEGRMPVVKLAERVNLSPTPCAKRMHRLEDVGVIEGYYARVNPVAINRPLVIFVNVILKNTDEKNLKLFNSAVKPIEQILECHLVGGGPDYILKIRTQDVAEFRKVLSDIVDKLPMIESTTTYFVMEQVKESPLIPIPKVKELR